MSKWDQEYNEDGHPIVRRFTPLSELPAPPVTEWLADDWLPLGGISLLVAEEGIGKTTLTNLIHALVTSGSEFAPMGFPRTGGATTAAIYFEDSRTKIDNSIKAMGGDVSRVLQLQDTTGDPDALTGAATIDDLKALEGQDCQLVTVDPVSEMIAPGVNMGVATEARKALAPFADFARNENACVLLIGHTNRQSTPNLRDRAGLSAQLRMIARSFLVALAYETEADGPGMLVGISKSNLVSPLPPALHFRTRVVDGTRFDSRGRVERIGTVEFVRRTDKTIAEWANELHAETSRESDTSDCAEWLRERFGDALWIDGKAATQDARGMYSESQLRTARIKLGIERSKRTVRYEGQGAFQIVWWGLQPMADDEFGRYMTVTEHARKPLNWAPSPLTSEDVA